MRNVSTNEMCQWTGLPIGSVGLLSKKLIRPKVDGGHGNQNGGDQWSWVQVLAIRVARGLREHGFNTAVCRSAAQFLLGFTEFQMAATLRSGRTTLPIIHGDVICRLVPGEALTNNPALDARLSDEFRVGVSGVDISLICKKLFDRIREADAQAKVPDPALPQPEEAHDV